MTETEGFLLEHAMQLGFTPNDDAGAYVCTEKQLVQFTLTIMRHAYSRGLAGAPPPTLLAESDLWLTFGPPSK